MPLGPRVLAFGVLVISSFPFGPAIGPAGTELGDPGLNEVGTELVVAAEIGVDRLLQLSGSDLPPPPLFIHRQKWIWLQCCPALLKRPAFLE